MTQSRKPRSIKATPEGLLRLRDARKERDWTNQKISDWTCDKYGKAGIGLDSVKNFITNNNPVQPGTVQKITEALGLKPEDVVDPEEWEVVTRKIKPERKSIPDIDVLHNRHDLTGYLGLLISVKCLRSKEIMQLLLIPCPVEEEHYF